MKTFYEEIEEYIENCADIQTYKEDRVTKTGVGTSIATDDSADDLWIVSSLTSDEISFMKGEVTLLTLGLDSEVVKILNEIYWQIKHTE
ncbi:hypothetical protein [Acetobacterium malicum]|nr:hypothetical protein [Acetobacterium malicum]